MIQTDLGSLIRTRITPKERTLNCVITKRMVSCGRKRKCTPAISDNPRITVVDSKYPKASTGSLPLCPIISLLVQNVYQTVHFRVKSTKFVKNDGFVDLMNQFGPIVKFAAELHLDGLNEFHSFLKDYV